LVPSKETWDGLKGLERWVEEEDQIDHHGRIVCLIDIYCMMAGEDDAGHNRIFGEDPKSFIKFHSITSIKCTIFFLLKIPLNVGYLITWS
jgi:hypothetical protein